MTADTSGKKSRVYEKNGQGRLALKNNGPLYSYPMGIWFLVFFVAPILIILVFSFMKQDYYGGVIKEFSIEAYKQVFSPMYGKVYLRTFWISIVSTGVIILLALPCGYAMEIQNVLK